MFQDIYLDFFFHMRKKCKDNIIRTQSYRVFSSHETSSGGRASGLNIILVKDYAISSDGINVRRWNLLRAVEADVVPALFVGNNKHLVACFKTTLRKIWQMAWYIFYNKITISKHKKSLDSIRPILSPSKVEKYLAKSNDKQSTFLILKFNFNFLK